MDNIRPIRPVVWDKLGSSEAELIIRRRAAKTSNVILIGHPEEREAERGFDRVTTFRILREGHVDPASMKQLPNGDWEMVVAMRIKGRREAGVATIVVKEEEKLIVKTVMWIH